MKSESGIRTPVQQEGWRSAGTQIRVCMSVRHPKGKMKGLVAQNFCMSSAKQDTSPVVHDKSVPGRAAAGYRGSRHDPNGIDFSSVFLLSVSGTA